MNSRTHMKLISVSAVAVILLPTAVVTITHGNYPCSFSYLGNNNVRKVTSAQSISLSPFGSEMNPVLGAMPGKVAGNISIGYQSSPMGIAYDSETGDLYVADSGLNTVTVIDGTTNRIVKNISVGQSPEDVAYDGINEYLYVVNSDSGTVSVINGTTEQVVTNIEVGAYPVSVTVDTSNGFIFTANFESNDVSVINGSTNRVISSISVGESYASTGPDSILYDQDNGLVYVSLSDTGTIAALNATAEVDILSVGNDPEGMAVDSSSGNLMVSIFNSNVITIVGPDNSILGKYSVGLNPLNILSDPLNGLVYVTDGGQGAVSVLNASSYSYASLLIVGVDPEGISLDTSTGDIYVPSLYSGQVFVISTGRRGSPLTTYNVTFEENGLPAERPWSASLGKVNETTSASIISFQKPDGTYKYTIGGVTDYNVSPSKGVLAVTGRNVTVKVNFSLSGSVNPRKHVLPEGQSPQYVLLAEVAALVEASALASSAVIRRIIHK